MLKLWCIFDYDVRIYCLWLYFISYISTYYSIHNGMYIYVCVYIYWAPIFGGESTMVKLHRGTWLQVGRAEWAAKRRVRCR